MRASGYSPTSYSMTGAYHTSPGVAFSVLHATVHAPHPTHLAVSMTIPHRVMAGLRSNRPSRRHHGRWRPPSPPRP